MVVLSVLTVEAWTSGQMCSVAAAGGGPQGIGLLKECSYVSCINFLEMWEMIGRDEEVSKMQVLYKYSLQIPGYRIISKNGN